jgi:hypothetical protein
MLSHERAEPGDIFVPDGIALGAQLVQSSIDIDRVPQHNAIQDDTQRS